MPKTVIPGERRRVVGEAVVRIMTRTGVEGASLRNLADETGLSIGSIRHYFESHDELVVFAMRELGRRIRQRVATRVARLPAGGLGSTDAVAELLAELLPLDRARSDDLAAWPAFTVAARAQPALREVAEEHREHLRCLVTGILEQAVQHGALPAGLNLGIESFRLSALLDGLTMQAVLHPQPMTPDLLVEVLRRNVHSLTTQTGS
ncbi:TetR/AcrR family transcriptional regulator [Nocardia sp. NRRL S-836]|uniref:TetR/AcrR family transcriptional regulator n=1 Tax=Nocardia sp. NRRL S-836 TaxID=1519492 RepID=UPI0006AE0963|nr:TetR/AcrR family transcriptional regulator [Nocardia sp. NRRL S-836]KOV85292.1 TetR family transcriptional regulator [Nocardia sp. NRRL S-836]